MAESDDAGNDGRGASFDRLRTCKAPRYPRSVRMRSWPPTADGRGGAGWLRDGAPRSKNEGKRGGHGPVERDSASLRCPKSSVEAFDRKGGSPHNGSYDDIRSYQFAPGGTRQPEWGPSTYLLLAG